MKKNLPRFRLGFTLIELLVVIALLAVLAVIGFAVFSSLQKNARDAKRKADIDAIAAAYEATYEPISNTYESITSSSKFVSGVPPTAPAGSAAYTYADGPNASSPTTNSYKVCAILEDNTSYCRSNQQGTPSIVAFIPPPPGSASSSNCYTIANGGAAGNTAANNSWVNWWLSLPSTASNITIWAKGGTKYYTTASAANAQTILSNMKSHTFFSIADNGVTWAGAANSSTTGCGYSENFGIASASYPNGCSCNAAVLIIPGYPYAGQVLCSGNNCDNSCTGSTIVCVYP